FGRLRLPMISDYPGGRLAGCPVSDRDYPALSAQSGTHHGQICPFHACGLASSRVSRGILVAASRGTRWAIATLTTSLAAVKTSWRALRSRAGRLARLRA